MQTTSQDDEQDESGYRCMHSNSDDGDTAEKGSQSDKYGAYDGRVCAAGTTPTTRDATKSVANASSYDFTVTEWSRPFTPYGAGRTKRVEWTSDKTASHNAGAASTHRYDGADVRRDTTSTAGDTLGMHACWSAGRRHLDYDRDKRDDGKPLRVGSPKRDDDNTWTYDTDKRDDGKTWEGRVSQHDDDETWKNTDGHTWRYGSDKWDYVNTRTNTDHEYQSWSSDDIWSAQTKTSDSCYKNTHGEAAAGQSSGNYCDHNAQEWHAEKSQVKHSENSDTKTAEKLDTTDDQAPAVLEELPDTTGNDTVVVREGGVDAVAELVTEVKAADAGADVSREEG